MSPPAVPIDASSRRRALAVAALAGLGVAALVVAASRGVFVYGDDILVYQVTESIWERGEVSVASPFRRGDIARSQLGVDGQRYAKYGLGLSLEALPFYGLGDWLRAQGRAFHETRDRFGNLRTGTTLIVTSWTNALVLGLLAATLVLAGAETGAALGAALAAALALVLATPLFHYATGFLSEPSSALCCALLAYASIRERSAPGSPSWLGLAGVAAGWGLLVKVVGFASFVPIVVWMGWRGLRLATPRARLVALTALAIPIAAAFATLFVYNHLRFGSIWETGYQAEASRFETPWLTGIGGLLLSPGKGLLWFAPPVALALVGWPALRRRLGGLAAALLAGAAIALLLAARFYQWHGGGVWGPRLVAPLVPIVGLALPLALNRWRGAGPRFRILASIAIVAGLAATLLVVVVPFEDHVQALGSDPVALERAVWRVEDSPLVDHARVFPEALVLSLRKLVGRAPLRALYDPAREPPPDAAFVRYESDLLRKLTLAALAAGLALLVFSATVASPRRRSTSASRD